MAATSSNYSYNGNLLGEIHASTSYTTLTRSSSSSTATVTATSTSIGSCTGEPLSLDLSEIPQTAHTCDTFALFPQGGCSPYILTAVWDPNDGSDTVMIVEIASGIELNHSRAWFATSPTNSTLSFRVQDASRNIYDSYTSLETLILPPIAGVVDPEWCLLTDTDPNTTASMPTSAASTSTNIGTRTGTSSVATETATVSDPRSPGDIMPIAVLAFLLVLTLAGIATITLLHRRLHRQYTALLENEPAAGGSNGKVDEALFDKAEGDGQHWQAAQSAEEEPKGHAAAWTARVPAQLSSIFLLAQVRRDVDLQDSGNEADPARTAQSDGLEHELDPFADVNDIVSSASASASRRVSSRNSSESDEVGSQHGYRYSVASFAPSSILTADTRDTEGTTHTQMTQVSEALSTEYYGRTQTRTVPLRDPRPRRG